MDANFYKSFIKTFASDLIDKDAKINFQEDFPEIIDSKLLFEKVLSLLKNRIDISESRFKKMFDIEFLTVQDCLKDAQSQKNKNVSQLIPRIADIIIAKRILISLNKISIQKEHSKLVYRMH